NEVKDLDRVFILIILVMNVFGFISMGWDKLMAKKRAWRTPEASLFGIALLGGSLGSLVGMYVFHHKTKKPAFKYGIPLMLVLNIICIYYVLVHYIK
ncbi:MAG: DUF1294 domain-containing protein, partial [Clostridia bacterium]